MSIIVFCTFFTPINSTNICWLPNREINITGTAPCSTGTGYSTNMVRLPSWYCPTFFADPLCSIFLSVYATYVSCSLYCWHDASPFCWAEVWWRIFDASHFEYCYRFTQLGAHITSIAMDDRPQPPPPTDAPNAGDSTGPLRIGDFIIEGVDRVTIPVMLSWHIKTLPVW